METAAPSPKSQLHEVGLFVDPSVNATESGANPEPGDRVNEATGATTGVVTVTVNTADVSLPPAFVAVKRTLNTPPALNVCEGFCVVTSAVPSPKFQLHDVGALVEVSMKFTRSGAAPESAEAVNDATGTGTGADTTSVWMTLSEPALFVTVSVTS